MREVLSTEPTFTLDYPRHYGFARGVYALMRCWSPSAGLDEEIRLRVRRSLAQNCRPDALRRIVDEILGVEWVAGLSTPEDLASASRAAE